MSEPIRYVVRMPRPHTHRLEVEARFPASFGTLTVRLPVWTPGSYLVREFARHLIDVCAEDDQGAPLPCVRVDKRSFRIDAGGRAATVRYGVYANELSVRTSHLDGSHAFWNGANIFVYDEDRRKLEHRVRVEAPTGWKIFTALEAEGGEHVASDYDELVDSPFEVGPHQPLHFEVLGVPHRLVIWGEPLPDPARMVADVTRVCEQVAGLFGALPLRRYLFIVHLTDKGRSGLEHQSSAALLCARFSFGSPRGWEDFLHLVAHEYFHLWFIKRIRPLALVAYDYGQENYTRLLWAFEGLTSYYDLLLPCRAKLTSPAAYLQRLGEAITRLHGTPGRKAMTLEEASLQTWVKHYRPDENTPNSAISYYLKGELVGWLLDLRIRKATSDARSLDDLMRLLWQRHGGGAGVPEDGLEAAAQEVAGVDLKEFFDQALRSNGELDYSPLSHVGLEVRFRPRESPGDKGGTAPRSKEWKPAGWLGATTRASGAVAVVLEGSPAMEAGLYPDDEVVALDGYKVDGGALAARLEERAPGDEAVLTAFRRERLIELRVVLGARPEDAAWLVRVEQPSGEQQAAYAAWLDA